MTDKPFEIGERVYYVTVDKDGFWIKHVMVHELHGEYEYPYREGREIEEEIIVVYQHYYDAGVEWVKEYVPAYKLFRTQEQALEYARKRLTEIYQPEVANDD